MNRNHAAVRNENTRRISGIAAAGRRAAFHRDVLPFNAANCSRGRLLRSDRRETKQQEPEREQRLRHDPALRETDGVVRELESGKHLDRLEVAYTISQWATARHPKSRRHQVYRRPHTRECRGYRAGGECKYPSSP